MSLEIGSDTARVMMLVAARSLSLSNRVCSTGPTDETAGRITRYMAALLGSRQEQILT
jgi:hypothetical protein